MIRRLLSLPLLIAGMTADGLAQEVEVAEIIVTGRGLESGRGDDLFDLVTIGRDRLAHSASNRLEDVLREVPGFAQFRRSDARSANPTSQGATLRALGGNASSRALLIFDGVPQTDPFGGWISWPAYDPRRLADIRVVRGGGSGIHGPGALAGTIELASAVPDETGQVSAALAYGSRDGVDGFAGAALPLGEGFIMFSGTWASGDGFVPVVRSQRGPVDRPSPYRQASFAVRAVTPLGSDTELQTNLSAFTDARERGTAFTDIDTGGANASLRLVGRGGLPFSALAYVQVRDFSNQFAAVNPDRTAVALVLDQYSVPSTGIGMRFELRPITGPLEFRLGGDWRETEGRTQELFQFMAGRPTRGRVAGGRTRTIGGFAEASWEHGDLMAVAGGRLDRWWIADGQLRERLLATGTPLADLAFPDRAGWEITGRAGAGWRLSPLLTFRAAAYRGWRLPTLNELYRPFRVGPDATAANAALAPERLDGVEAGFDARPFPGARFGLTLFANRLAEAIANVTLGEGPGIFPGVGFVAGAFRQRRNLDAIVSRGIEIDGNLTAGRWQFSAGYSLADAKVRGEGAAAPLDRLRPAQAPRHSASLTATWTNPNHVRLDVAMRYVGSQFEDDLNRQRIPDALTFDATALVTLNERMAIEARAENLTDAQVVAGISAAGTIERATPRTIWIGLRWSG